MSLPDPFNRLAGMLGSLPGIGAKTARRLTFFMLSQSPEWLRSFASAVSELRDNIKTCSICGNLSVSDICDICSDPRRDSTKICVVETQEDCAAIEQSDVWDGVYHVLGGRFSPLGDEEIPAASLSRLRERADEPRTVEVVLAMDPSVEGDMTAYAVMDALTGTTAKITRLAYGLPAGGSIGYTDRMTLHMAIDARTDMS